MEYPISLKFKVLTFGQQITATDRNGKSLMYIKQKMFKLKEKVEIYSDKVSKQVLFTIGADRIIDFSANYHFRDAAGNDWGSVRRKGMRSLWSAHYEVIQNGQLDATIDEESPMKKVAEAILGEIPLVGFIAVLLLNPSYIVRSPEGTPLLRLIKRPAVFEGKYTLEKLSEMSEDDELRCLMSLIMLVLLERRRG